MAEALPRFIHLVAASFWVGSQLFMFLVGSPALAVVKEQPVRRQALDILTRRFVTLGWLAIGVLVLTGALNILHRGTDVAFSFHLRYAWILSVKLGLVATAIGLTALHSYVLGPRLIELQMAAVVNPGRTHEVRRFRGLSVAISALNLLVALAILYLAALLTRPFAFAPS